MRLVALPGVFQPPSDAFMLAESMEREQVRGASVLDLCTGSGFLAVRAALAGAGEVVAVDVSRRAVLSARLNAALNGVRVTGLRGDLFGPVAGGKFDLVITNPPYLPGPDERLPSRGPSRAWEGGNSGRAFIDRICSEVSAHLRPGGVVLMVHSSVCDIERSVAMLARSGLQASVPEIRRGPLGPLLQARARWLRRRGLVGIEDAEEIAVIRGQRESAASPQPQHAVGAESHK